ncbi:uncharacterized protein LOC127287550 [Leptopilina boulardi]|uniref:uncharacterized protein LOC127287550 n=1 Tax=Leptopilina boulardi TaxID=63433 RepID=UPI0021F60365|nr:uncharacterized protein LOC127287550 [Leptopilina boulardi]
MGKWGKYLKHYNAKWESEEELKGWLTASSEEDIANGKPEAFCKLCNCHIRAHHGDLIAHSKRVKHVEREKALNRKQQKRLHNYNVVIEDKDKILEIKLSVFVALHCAVRGVDHLCEMLKLIAKGSPQLENLRLHRTKCSTLLANVISPVQLQELISDIGDCPYALIVDESTDVSVTKFMGVCVRYFSLNHKKMVTDYLGIIKVVSCTSENLANALKKYLSLIGLPFSQLYAIGTDSATNMCNTFYACLKRELTHLQLIRCVCHSLDNCSKYANKTVPNHLEFILTETYDWFSLSSKRHGEYDEFFKERHDGKSPAKLQSLSKTRWLIWLPVSSVVLDQWDDLRDFFVQTTASQPQDFKRAL